MRHVRVIVQRDPTTKVNRSLPEWEVPLLEAVFGEGNVEMLDEYVNVPGEEYPEANSEFPRLADSYGKDSDSGVAYAAIVYGGGNRGVKALSLAIKKAEEDEAQAVQEQKPAPARRSVKRRSADAESLLA